MVNRFTYHIVTKADFTPCSLPNRKPDFISECGSKYWYDANSVTRSSDHWGRVGLCLWTLDGKSPELESEGWDFDYDNDEMNEKAGVCLFSKFKEAPARVFKKLSRYSFQP